MCNFYLFIYRYFPCVCLDLFKDVRCIFVGHGKGLNLSFYSKIKKIKVDNISDETEFGPEHSLGAVQDLDVYISGKTDQIPSM